MNNTQVTSITAVRTTTGHTLRFTPPTHRRPALLEIEGDVDTMDCIPERELAAAAAAHGLTLGRVVDETTIALLDDDEARALLARLVSGRLGAHTDDQRAIVRPAVEQVVTALSLRAVERATRRPARITALARRAALLTLDRELEREVASRRET